MRLNLDGELVAVAKELLRLLSRTDAGGCTGEDDGTRGQRGTLGAETDEFGDLEDEVTEGILGQHFAKKGKNKAPKTGGGKKTESNRSCQRGEVCRNLLYPTILQDLAVLQASDMQFLGIGDQRRRRQNGPDGTGAVEAFAEAPLALCELGGAARDVVCGREAQDVAHGVGLGYVLCGL